MQRRERACVYMGIEAAFGWFAIVKREIEFLPD
jgi:hypothetical protein